MDLHQIEYVVEIARENNISRAAQNLHISQPTLSIFLNGLEKNLNLKLFHRANNVLTITEAGEKYVEAGKKILVIRDKLYSELYTDQQITIRMGVLSSSAAIFGKVFQEFKQLNPNVMLVPFIRKSNVIYEELMRGEYDFGFITSYSEKMEQEFHKVNFSIMKEYELMITMSRNHPIYSQLDLNEGCLQEKDYEKLNQLSFAYFPIPMIQDRIEHDILPKLSFRPKSFTQMMNLEFMTTTLYLEPVLAICPLSHFNNPDIVQISLPFHPRIHKVLIYPKGRKISLIERQFIDLVSREFAQYPYYYDL